MVIETPEDFELVGFFESEPVETEPQDGFFAYEFTDKNGVTLVFSFNAIEGSVQARLLVKGSDVALFSQEGAKKIKMEDDASGNYLRCYFDIDGSNTDAQIRLAPYITVRWAILKS